MTCLKTSDINNSARARKVWLTVSPRRTVSSILFLLLRCSVIVFYRCRQDLHCIDSCTQFSFNRWFLVFSWEADPSYNKLRCVRTVRICLSYGLSPSGQQIVNVQGFITTGVGHQHGMCRASAHRQETVQPVRPGHRPICVEERMPGLYGIPFTRLQRLSFMPWAGFSVRAR